MKEQDQVDGGEEGDRKTEQALKKSKTGADNIKQPMPEGQAWQARGRQTLHRLAGAV